MILECAKLLVATAREDNVIEATLFEEYSGRGMYGRKTTGIILSRASDLAVLACIAGHNAADSDATYESLVVGLQGLQIDNMGRDVIVY